MERTIEQFIEDSKDKDLSQFTGMEQTAIILTKMVKEQSKMVNLKEKQIKLLEKERVTFWGLINRLF